MARGPRRSLAPPWDAVSGSGEITSFARQDLRSLCGREVMAVVNEAGARFVSERRRVRSPRGTGLREEHRDRHEGEAEQRDAHDGADQSARRRIVTTESGQQREQCPELREAEDDE